MKPQNHPAAPGRKRATSKTEKVMRPAEGPSPSDAGVVVEAADRAFSERLLVELLDASLSLPSDQLDREIERCLRRICEFFDLDRCLVWQFLEWEPGALRLTHVPQGPGDPPAQRDADPGRPSDTSRLSESTETPPMLLRTDAKVFFPWLTQQLKDGTSVVLPRVEDVPADAAHDRETFAAYHTRSLVAVPLMSGRTALGALSFATVRAHRDWSELEVRRFRLIAHVLGLTLANRRPAMALDRTEARLALAADSAEIGLWMLEPTSGQFWASDRARHLFGYGADTQITMASFLETVQPEDRERTHEAVRRALDAGQEVDVEYRIVRPDRSVRWIRSRGRAWASSSGESPHLLGVSTDVTERKESEEAQAEQLRFETLLSDLSSQLVNLPADRLDGAIVDAQRQVCECLGFDMSGLWQGQPDSSGSYTLTHLYRRHEGPPAPDRVKAREYFPWCLAQLTAGKVVALPSIDEAPPEAARDQEVWRHYGVKTSLSFPLAAGDGPAIGFLAFDTTVAERSLPEPMVQRLRLVAEVLANALARARAERDLREREARLAAAADVAGLGFSELRSGTHLTYCDDRLAELLGVPSDEREGGREFWLAHLHPDDHERILALSRQVHDGTLDRASATYRYLHPSKGTVWISQVSRVLDRDAQGRVSHLVSVMQDITERLQAREALERAQAHTLAVINSTSDMVWSVDPERHGLLTWNRALKDYFFTQLHIELAVGKTPEELLPPDYAARWHEMYARAVQEGSFTTEYPVSAGETTLLLSIQPMQREGEVFAISVFGKDITELKRSEEALRQSLDEVRRLKNKLEMENRYLQKEHSLLHGRGRMVGESPAILRVLSQVEQVAPTTSTVLVEGETGVGKELVAQRIHELSPRRSRPIVKVNCAALPSNLVESELFGREKGAYTGAVSREAGRFEVASGSTIFLDEVGELPVELQAKLLRVLEEGQFERVGSSRTLSTDVRIIAATNRDLRAEVEQGRFRRDLYYRLAVFPIRVPPLRERRQDIPLLVWSAVEGFCATMHRTVESIPTQDMERLQRYDWPGNVRELRNVVERALILCSEPVLRIAPPSSATMEDEADLSLDEAQRRQIARALDACNGRISGPGGAAERLGLKPTTLRSRMERLRIDPRRSRDDDASS
ncbi:MAG: sigma 54-interacting transcriptional regulator [Thermoanaerobaculaceae bacterium]|nr:sigma 54-interacting transcriptional regulator [Thermoanaerobaculaceae bacterium]